VAIVCGDDPRIRKLFQDFPKMLVTYGFEKTNDYRIEGQQSKYKLYKGEELIGDFRMQVPGRHNALNATAAILSGFTAGVPFEKCLRGIEAYGGVDRRFQKKASSYGIDYYDDYGHHPTEVVATLAAFKEQFPDRRLVVLFQPHRFSRTQTCWKDFTSCFRAADKLFLLDIYAAGEAPIADVTAKKLAQEMDHKDCTYHDSKLSARDAIHKTLKNGDIFLTLGAGDVYKLGEEIALLAKK
jgi:UDP-N-acetylmuramate--alanine ligase